jgi:type I restriction enzyme M protein
VLAKRGGVRTIYDPTAGTGGMLSVAGESLSEHNPRARLTRLGQELNPASYAICLSDMLIEGQDTRRLDSSGDQDSAFEPRERSGAGQN